jgi:fucose permease
VSEPSATRSVAARRLEIAGWVAMFAYAASTQAPSICLPQIGDELGLNPAGRGLIASFRTISLLVALLAAGHFAGRFGKAIFLVAGMGLVAAGVGGTTVAFGYISLLIAQAVLGAGNGMMESLVNPLVAEIRPKDAARALNITHAFYPMGLVASSLIAGEMLERGVPWRASIGIWLPLALVSCALFWTPRYPRPEKRAEGSGGRGLGFLRKRVFWGLMLAMVLAGGSELGVTTWAPSFLQEELHSSARSGALTIAFFGAAMALGRFLSGWILRRVSSITLTAASAVLCAVSMWGFRQSSDPRVAWVFVGCAGLTVACFWPTLLAIAVELLEDTSTAMLALLAAAGIFGCALFPGVLGVLGDRFGGLRAGLAMLPIAMLLLALLLVAVGRAAAHSRRAA